MTEGQWHNVRRVVHLVGGLRAINNPGSEVIIRFGSSDPGIPFSINMYHDLPCDLIALGLKIVGIDYYQTLEELKGYHPPMWYSFATGRENKGSSSIINVENNWSGLAYAAFKAEKIELMDICSLPISKLGNLPSIYFPIPSNPFSVKEVRSKGSPFETVAELFEASNKVDDSAPDALEYCLYSVGNMISLAFKIAQEAPISPEILTFITRVDIKEVMQ